MKPHHFSVLFSTVLISLFFVGSISLLPPAQASACITSAATAPKSAVRKYRTKMIDRSDRPTKVILSVLRRCCGSQPAHAAGAEAQTICRVKVEILYCHTVPTYPTPRTICYWMKKTVEGVYNPDGDCCAVTLKDVNGKTYCIKDKLVIGPIFS